jgi:hypothetical protein
VHHILAAVTPDNTPNGYYWTFLFPMLLFIFIGTVLYLLFSRPHRRVPARAIVLRGASSQGSWAGAAAASPADRATAMPAAPAAEPGSAAAPEAGDGEQAEGDAASAGDAESSE